MYFYFHRIPGISDKFLYFNDDVMLGAQVWPEDFITQANGQKIYLAWWVPDCSDVCPWAWVGDGSCDPACNTTLCEFDGSIHCLHLFLIIIIISVINLRN